MQPAVCSGGYAASLDGTCEPCEAGQYSAGGNDTYHDCDQGSYSTSGSSNCTVCDAGTTTLGSKTALLTGIDQSDVCLRECMPSDAAVCGIDCAAATVKPSFQKQHSTWLSTEHMRLGLLYGHATVYLWFADIC